MRLVVTGLDLQQPEHRGIAVYSKALLKALRQSGAELWLLTDFDPSLRGASLRRAPTGVRQLVFSARVLEALNRGFQPTLIPLASTTFARRYEIVRKILKVWASLSGLSSVLVRKKKYHLNDARRVDLSTLVDSPYSRIERLFYLEDLTGILCADNVFVNSFRAALSKDCRPVEIRLGDFDGLVSTCPLHICCDQDKPFVQTVHDLIPLEYVQTTDHAGAFSRRLESCGAAHRLFVSSSTQKKYQLGFGSAMGTSEAVVIQPPSLQIPEPYKRRLLEQDELNPNHRAKARNSTLKAFRYVLFNSSVEPRKNLLFVIKAFRLSGLAKQGIRLCVTGMLRGDPYSKAVGEQADYSVLLTDYIDETTKASLFLHAMAVLSPSLVEGFGIPVLDAACLGAPVIASPSESHREIQALHDFQKLVWICDTRDPLDWAMAMKDLASAQLSTTEDTAAVRQQRLGRYDVRSSEIFERFRKTVCEQVLAGVKSETAGSGVRG